MRKIVARLLVVMLIPGLLCTPFFAQADLVHAMQTEEDSSVLMQAEEAAKDMGDAEYDGFIFKLKDDVLLPMSAEDPEGIENIEYASGVYTAETLDDIESFVPESCIEYVEPNHLLYMLGDEMTPNSTLEPNDKYYETGYQWNLDQLKVQEAWGMGIEGQDLDNLTDMDYDGDPGNDKVVIAVIDSGLKEGHEDIDWTHIIPGKNFLSSSSDSTDDTQGHGTFCTGLMMAQKDNGKGIAGIAQDIYVMPLKVFDSRSTSTSVIVNAINYATTQRMLFDDTKGAQGTNIRVINMSLGGESSDVSLKSAVSAAIESGIIVVCAAGNDGDATASYPAQYAMGIGSTDSASRVSSYSQRLSLANGSDYSNKVWVMAPGEEVTSLFKESTSSYYTASGTSFSSPEIAALAGLSVSLCNDLTVYYPDAANNHEAFKMLLKDTARPITGKAGDINGQDVEYGWGLVDFGSALTTLVGEMDGEGKVTVRVQNEAGTEITGAQLKVTDPDNNDETVEPNADGTYTLKCGRRYSYTASADKYETKSGILVTLSDERTMLVTLVGQAYVTRFEVWNSQGGLIANPEITVSRLGGALVNQNADGSFSTRNGIYNYTINAGGYFPCTETFVIDDMNDSTLANKGKRLSVVMHGDIDVCSVKMTALNEKGADITDGTANKETLITVLDSERNEVLPYTDGYYKLVPGTYSYTVKNDDYKPVTGSLTIHESDKDTATERRVYLNDPLYNVYLNVMPLSVPRVVTVTNGLGEVEQRMVTKYDMDVQYHLCNGTYRYTVESVDYKTMTGTFTVKGKTQDIDLILESGSGTVDDGSSDQQFVTINSSYYTLPELKKYETSASYTIGGNQTEFSGIKLSDLVKYFINGVQTPSSLIVDCGSNGKVEVPEDEFSKSMIAWTDDGLVLAVDGENALVTSPAIVTAYYHTHTEVMTVETQPTCTESGSAHYVCSVCGSSRTVSLPPLGHDYGPDGVCTRCGDVLIYDDDTEIALQDRNGNALATVTSAEMRRYTTTATYTMFSYDSEETHEVTGILFSDLIEHFVPDECVVYLTATSLDGKSAYVELGDFPNAMLAWEIDGLPPGSYDYDNHLRIAVDNGSSGNWLYSPCLLTLNSHEHSYGEPTTVDATCKTGGYTYKTCSVCGHVYSYAETPATGHHTWDMGYVQTEPTCISEGKMIHHCLVCGDSKLEPLPVGGHSWQEDGTCEYCGKTMDAALVDITTVDNQAIATLNAPVSGWQFDAANTFTISSESPCVVMVERGGVYERLTPVSHTGNAYNFTVQLTEQSNILVRLAGDANADGALSSSDMQKAADMITADAVSAEMNLILDLDNDGELTFFDVMTLGAAARNKISLSW